MPEHYVHPWEQVTENLYRRRKSGLNELLITQSDDPGMIDLFEHEGRYLPEWEYDAIMDEKTTRTYDHLAAWERGDKEPFTLRTAITFMYTATKNLLKDLQNLDDRQLLEKYWRRM